MKRTRRMSRRDDLGPGSNTRAEIVSQPELWPVAVVKGSSPGSRSQHIVEERTGGRATCA